MRHPRLTSIMIVATASAVAGLLAKVSVLAQQPPAQPQAPVQSPAPAQSQAPAPPQAPAPAKPGPYSVVAIKLPAPVSDASFDRVKALFGDQGVIDLIGVSGYYVAVAMTLNVAQVPIPDGKPPPLKPLD